MRRKPHAIHTSHKARHNKGWEWSCFSSMKVSDPFQSAAIKTLRVLVLCLYKWRNEKLQRLGSCVFWVRERFAIIIRKNRAMSTALPWFAQSCKVLIQLMKHLNFSVKHFRFNCVVLADFCCPLGDVCQSVIIGRDLRVKQVVLLQQIYYFQELLPKVLGIH